MLGCAKYSTPIDIWSLGAIVAEMIGAKPLFQVSSLRFISASFFLLFLLTNLSLVREIQRLTSCSRSSESLAHQLSRLILEAASSNNSLHSCFKNSLCSIIGSHGIFCPDLARSDPATRLQAHLSRVESTRSCRCCQERESCQNIKSE